MQTAILSTQQTATQVGLSVRTVQRLHDLPRVKLSARRVGYREADVRRWVETRAAVVASK